MHKCGWGISPQGAGYTFEQDISEQLKGCSGLKWIAETTPCLTLRLPWNAQVWLGHLTTRSRVHLWAGHLAAAEELFWHQMDRANDSLFDLEASLECTGVVGASHHEEQGTPLGRTSHSS